MMLSRQVRWMQPSADPSHADDRPQQPQAVPAPPPQVAPQPVELGNSDAFAELLAFLQAQNVTKWYDAFVQHKVTFETLLGLEEADLKSMGITKGPRVKILKTAPRFRPTTGTQPAAQPLSPPHPQELAEPALPLSPAGSAGSQEHREPPEEFFCPISHEVMQDPVMVVATGMSYDRKHIEAWFESHSTDPSSGTDVGHVPRSQRLAPNVALRKMIATWRAGA